MNSKQQTKYKLVSSFMLSKLPLTQKKLENAWQDSQEKSFLTYAFVRHFSVLLPFFSSLALLDCNSGEPTVPEKKKKSCQR